MYSDGDWVPAYVSLTSASYVVLTYAWNCLTSSSVAAYVQLPTVSAPSALTAALTSSGVMSLLTIETWTVAEDAAALAAAEAGAVEAAVLGAAADGAATLGATDAPELVHALAVRMTTPMSAAIVRSLAGMVCRIMVLLLSSGPAECAAGAIRPPTFRTSRTGAPSPDRAARR